MKALSEWLEPAGRGHFEPEIWKSQDDSEALFLNKRGGRLTRQGGWGVVKKYGAKVGLGSNLSPHTIRHCCATHMLEHGADIRTVQELLGHASITTTQIYTKVSRTWLLKPIDLHIHEFYYDCKSLGSIKHLIARCRLFFAI